VVANDEVMHCILPPSSPPKKSDQVIVCIDICFGPLQNATTGAEHPCDGLKIIPTIRSPLFVREQGPKESVFRTVGRHRHKSWCINIYSITRRSDSDTNLSVINKRRSVGNLIANLRPLSVSEGRKSRGPIPVATVDQDMGACNVGGCWRGEEDRQSSHVVCHSERPEEVFVQCCEK